MEQFNLEKWLKDKSRKVVTRDGRIVEILKVDAKGNHPIIGVYQFLDTEDIESSWRIDGRKTKNGDSSFDLFFADEEPETIEISFGAKDSEFIKDEYLIPKGCKARIEGNKVIIERIQKEEKLTEFEKEVKDLMNSCCNEIEEADITNELVKEAALNLLDLARKELQSEFEAELDKAYKCADKVQYENGKKDAMKNIPTWKKASEYKEFDKHVILLERGNRVCLTQYVINGDNYIELDDLKKLPKEE